jgi:hypothetical protein
MAWLPYLELFLDLSRGEVANGFVCGDNGLEVKKHA